MNEGFSFLRICGAASMEMRNKQNWYKTSWWGSKFHRNKIRSVGTCQREWHCAYDRSYAGLCLKKHFCKALSLLPAHGFVSTSWSHPLFNFKLPTAFFQPPPGLSSEEWLLITDLSLEQQTVFKCPAARQTWQYSRFTKWDSNARSESILTIDPPSEHFSVRIITAVYIIYWGRV